MKRFAGIKKITTFATAFSDKGVGVKDKALQPEKEYAHRHIGQQHTKEESKE